MKSKSAFRLVHSGSPAACVFASAIAALLATPAVRATDFAWDPANDAAGGSNTWDASSSLWDSGTTPTAGNTNILWSNGAANQAFFAGAAGIVTLGTSISAGTLTFSSAGYQINTGINTLTLNSANTLTVTNSNVYGLEFVGATTLTAAPTFSVANASASNVVKGLVLTGPVTGAAGLTKSGTGMLQLNASAVLLGTLDVTGGGLHIGAAGAGARLADVVLENGTRLNLNGNAALFGSLTTPVSGSGMVTNTGALATLTVDNSSPAVNRLASAGVTLSGGTLNATGGDADESGSALTANLGLDTIVTGANTLVTAYSAYTTGDLGTTGASPDNFEPTGTQTHLTAGKTINSLNLTLQGGIAEGVTLNSGQTLTLGAGSSINNGSGNITGGILTTTGNAELSANYATGGSIGSIISGTSGGLTKLGAGNLTLSSPESFSGQTTVNQGTLTLAGGNNTLAVNNALRVNYGGTLDLGANNQYVNTLASAGTVEGSGGSIIGSGRLTTNAASGTFAGNIGGSVSLVKAGANTLTLPSATTTTGTLSVIGGGLTLKDGGTLAGLTGTPAINLNYATLTLDNTGFKDLGSRVKDDAPITMNGGTGGFQVDTTGQTLTLTGLIDGGGSLVKTGPGTLTLGGNNTYGGATTVNTGTLKAGVASVADGSGAFGLNSPITPATYAGVLSGTGMLTKIGTATQILTGSNTYSGATTVNGGSLLINGSNTGAGTVNVGVNGTLGGIGTIAGAVNVSGTLAPGASIGALTSGDLTFADNSTFRYQLNSSVPHATGAALQIVNGVLNFGSSVALLLTDLGTGSLSGGTVFSLEQRTLVLWRHPPG